MLLLIIAAVLALLVYLPSFWVRQVMNKHSQELSDLPGSGGELAKHLVKRYQLHGIKVEETQPFRDHFDPAAQTVRLSPDNFNGRSLTAIAIAAALLFALDVLPLQMLILGMHYQFTHAHWVPLIAFPLAFGLAFIGSHLVPADFEVHVSSKTELYGPIHSRLPFLGSGTLRILVAKDLVDLWRSRTLVKMLVSFTVPLLFLLLLAWLVDFASFPIPFNLLSYAPFLGFFGFQFYSWLNGMDPPDFLNGLPVSVPQLLRAKVVVYFLITTWISVLFLIAMGVMLDQVWALPAALIVMLANSVYIVSLTAFLMGLRPNKAIFDVSIMGWFYLGTIVPLLGLFLLSFTQGDMTIYENWGEQVREQGLNATTAVLVEVDDNPDPVRGLKGILLVSAAITILGLAFQLMLGRKWGRAAFEN